MEEIVMGNGAQHLDQINPGHMHRGHDLWNISLTFACEAWTSLYKDVAGLDPVNEVRVTRTLTGLVERRSVRSDPVRSGPV